MGLDLIRWKANERVGLPDQDAMSELVLEEMIRANRDEMLPTTITPKVFGGFGLSGYTPIGTLGVATLAQGRAIVKLQKDQALSHGFLLGLQAPTSYQLDFTAAGNDTYNVYVRAVYSDATFENRVFWNPGTSAEFVDYTATRRIVTWEVTYQSQSAASPAPEWMLVWEITVVSNLITAVNDVRQFYFEGNPDTTYDHEWGDGANDRDNDRALYGVKDRWTWDEAIRRQLADIIGDASGAHRWQKAPPIELLSLNVEHWSESESASGTPGWHKQVTVGPTGASHRLSSIDQDTVEVELSDQPDSPVFQMHADDGASNSNIAWKPRGAGALLTNGDDASRDIGDGGGGNPDFRETLTKIAADQYQYQLQLHGEVQVQMDCGSGIAQHRTYLRGQVQAGEEYRIQDGALPLTAILQVPLQILNNQGAGAWGYDEVLPGGAGRLTVAAAAAQIFTSCELVLPHLAVITTIRILWAQAVTGTGVNAGIRLWAKKHRIAQTTVGIIGGGTGAPTSIVPLKTALQYEEHLTSSGGAASPYRRVQEFTCDETVANRTFDLTQDKLVITLESPDDVGVGACSVYWIMVQYGIDYVSPPLV